jgi:hypothetical protein
LHLVAFTRMGNDIGAVSERRFPRSIAYQHTPLRTCV